MSPAYPITWRSKPDYTKHSRRLQRPGGSPGLALVGHPLFERYRASRRNRLVYRYLAGFSRCGFLVQSASGYGDCKDKVTLLSTMLREAGIDSYYMLIN